MSWRSPVFLAALTLAIAGARAGEFTLMVNNVNNLFDIDGVALFADFEADRYQPSHLLSKLENLSEVVASVDQGRGPDVILFQEFEVDQTPTGGPADLKERLAGFANVSLNEMLREPVSQAVRDLPVEAFVLKALEEAGLETYDVRVGRFQEDPGGRTITHTNAVFSRLPILESRTIPTVGARGILEVVIEVGDAPLFLFNNHWKSGASDLDDEEIRIGNARVLRERLDQILEQDPLADIVVAGDFNSQYNQSRRYTHMPSTALNDVLGSQGDEAALEDPDGPDLYNLWYELPQEERGSDIYRNEWGTLMQIMITRGLYARSGVTYVDNSFAVVRLPGRNAAVGTGVPIRWQTVDEAGYGYSDHLPLLAVFSYPDSTGPDWLELTNPGREDPAVLRRIAIAPEAVGVFPEGRRVSDPRNLGNSYRFTARVARSDPLRVAMGEEELPVWIPNPRLRAGVMNRWLPGAIVEFVATVGTYRGEWQLIIESDDWVMP